MKKLLIGIALLLCMGLDGFCTTGTDRDTKISIVIITGGRPLPRPRSKDAIQISVNQETGLLYALFDESFGVVSISVKNSMGITVASTQCDTSVESGAVLSVPTTADSYTLTIVGNDLEMVGYYDLE